MSEDRLCSGCGTSNPESRRFCRQCGARLAPTAPVATEPPEPPASVRPNRRLPALVSALAGVVVVAVIAGIVSRGGTEQRATAPPPSSIPAATTTVAPTVAGAPAKIDPATIVASASSVLPPEDAYSYGVRNTLDDRLDTAWNDGAPGPGAGEKLTYRFARPVQLVGIRLVNGFASTPDLYQQNARIRAVVFVTDTGRFPVTLADVAEPQEVTMDFGRTSSVILDVVTPYLGSEFEDLALTEIEFLALPG